MFLDEGGHAQAHGLVQQGTAGKPTDAHHHLRSVAFQQASRLPEAAQEHEGEHQVARAGQLPFHAGDPQAVDVVTGGGNLVHFHAPQGADKADVGLGVAADDLIGNRQRRVDVAACAASGNDDVGEWGHRFSALPCVFTPSPATTRDTASIMPMDMHVNSSEVPP